MEPFHLKRGVAQEQSFMHLLVLWFIHFSSTIIIASIKSEAISKLQPSLNVNAKTDLPLGRMLKQT